MLSLVPTCAAQYDASGCRTLAGTGPPCVADVLVYEVFNMYVYVNHGLMVRHVSAPCTLLLYRLETSGQSLLKSDHRMCRCLLNCLAYIFMCGTSFRELSVEDVPPGA